MRRPSPARPELGKPIYEKAIKQHDAYIEALKQCGVDVTVLPAMEEYPDQLLRRGHRRYHPAAAPSSTTQALAPCNGEPREMEPTIRQFFDDDHRPHHRSGTLEGGDVMMVGDHFYVGGPLRPHQRRGIRQFIEILGGLGPFRARCRWSTCCT